MQKKILALAVAGLMSGAAFAQSNVTVYGIMDLGYLNQDMRYSDSTNDSASNDLSRTGFEGALSASRIGFRGTEDLGNGLKANFVHEMGLAGNSGGAATDTAASFTTRLSYVGLSGSWGSFNIGRQAAVTDDAWAAGGAGMRNGAIGQMYNANVFGNLITTFAAVNVNTDNVAGIRRTSARLSDAWTYRSPSMSGFTVAAQYGKSDSDTSINGAATAQAEFSFYGLSAGYAAGPLNIVMAYGKEKTDALGGSTADNKQWTLGGNYNFGAATVFGLYTNGSNKPAAAGGINLNDSDGWELGVHVPVSGALTLMASYMDGKHKVSVNGVAGDAKVDYQGYQLAALYSLSKRTTAYAAYGDLTGKWSETGFNAKGSIDQYTFGIRHSF